jgi:hypothetical protein
MMILFYFESKKKREYQNPVRVFDVKTEDGADERRVGVGIR